MSEVLWGKRAKLSYLMLAAILLLFTLLGARDIWTQEHRWADIVFGMFYRQDFLHPYLGEVRYYDKPLLSYWLIVLTAKIMGQLTVWTLRLPSALAGLLAIFSIYQLGSRIKDKSVGLLAGWMLLTTYYFIFWARTSSADMLNLAGTFFAIAWYAERREKATFFDFVIFFSILALTSLCKGLGGAIVPLLAVFVDVMLRKSWRQYLKVSVFLSMIPAIIIYVTPFLASSFIGGENYADNGLYLVYKENILRYFKPFDHQGPIYTYFIYLPIYLFPWTLFFIPALICLPKRWKNLSLDMKWMSWTLFAVFMFFTMSGSRRSYYVLPLVPFAILMTADWLLSTEGKLFWKKVSSYIVVFGFIAMFLALDLVPAWYYSKYGVQEFASGLQTTAATIKPWSQWEVVMLDAESKLNFYLKLPPDAKQYSVKSKRENITNEDFLESLPILSEAKNKHIIYISRKRYLDKLLPYFHGFTLYQLNDDKNGNSPIAFIPNK